MERSKMSPVNAVKEASLDPVPSTVLRIAADASLIAHGGGQSFLPSNAVSAFETLNETINSAVLKGDLETAQSHRSAMYGLAIGTMLSTGHEAAGVLMKALADNIGILISQHAEITGLRERAESDRDWYNTAKEMLQAERRSKQRLHHTVRAIEAAINVAGFELVEDSLPAQIPVGLIDTATESYIYRLEALEPDTEPDLDKEPEIPIFVDAPRASTPVPVEIPENLPVGEPDSIDAIPPVDVPPPGDGTAEEAPPDPKWERKLERKRVSQERRRPKLPLDPLGDNGLADE